ncbi:MAG TPA: aldo/keto reductase [Proteiniclasticum sp.]|uniref:aldo/keto reductase n=1 Tax=Proteiniclasticum sp. TaxID=2053595 RepID=UPI000E90FCB6|nr:aldo/keto reductase [Proteiniclasticum sp.]HBW12716.1 aldo/keto reductase [Proteiniclasticum sp.]
MKQHIKLKDGTSMPRLGQGTWNMGEDPKHQKEEIEALQEGIRLGMTLIDTAEMYGEGRSEKLVGEAIKTFPREDLFLVSKVYPHNAGRKNIFTSLKRSLERLDTPYLDLYLLHWRGSVPLSETIACMEEMKKEGLIKNWGVSNFDTDDMQELLSCPSGDQCSVNQVLYHLGSRGIEYDLLPYLKEENIALMAYCPLGHDKNKRRRITEHPVVREVAKKHSITPLQLMLSFTLVEDSICSIPKASSLPHVKENAESLHLTLTEEDLLRLNEAFPAPRKSVPLDML